jgi:Ras-related protein Rab-40
MFSAYKTTTILLDGKRVKLQVWDTSGQGRFCTIIRSYSRGAQGVLLVYDITSKWSFDGIDRWLKEVEEVMNLFFILNSQLYVYNIKL